MIEQRSEMMMRIQFIGLLGAAAMLLTGCAGRNEGMSDIRFATAGGWQVGNSGPAAVAPIEPNSVVLITLERLYMKSFDEFRFTPQRLLTGGRVFDSQGQIAVLVGTPGSDGPSSSTDLKDHYVIFYSNDVTEGQLLNFRNQRVFGPTRITDQRFEIDFVLLEIDRPSEQDAALLTRLAHLGQTYGGVGGPGLTVLTDLGQALLSAPNDDVEMRYRFTFDLGNRPNARLPMRPGLYAIIRDEDRSLGGTDAQSADGGSGQTDWAKVCIDRDTGELYQDAPQSDGKCGNKRFTASSYLVINIEAASLTETTIAQQRFSQLTDSLRTMTNPSSTAIQTALDRAASDYAEESQAGDIWNALTGLSARAASFGALPPPECPAQDSVTRPVRQALVEEVVTVHRLMSEAADSFDLAEDKRYNRALYRQQAAQLARFFGLMEWPAVEGEADSTPEGRLVQSLDPAKFQTVFGDVSLFRARVEARAVELWQPVCPASV